MASVNTGVMEPTIRRTTRASNMNTIKAAIIVNAALWGYAYYLAMGI